MRCALFQCVRNSPVYVIMIEFVNTAIYDNNFDDVRPTTDVLRRFAATGV